MYSQELQEYLQELSLQAEVDPDNVFLLRNQMSSLVGILGEAIGGIPTPPTDLLEVSMQLLLLDEGISNIVDDWVSRGHYIVGLGFEQTGSLLNRIDGSMLKYPPLENDHWYRLSLSLLHYLAGGFRVQALSTLRQLFEVLEKSPNDQYKNEYQQANESFQYLYYGSSIVRVTNAWEDLMFGDRKPIDYQEVRIQRLANKIRDRRDALLGDLGINHETEWLKSRGVTGLHAVDFWRAYLLNLQERGITTFTNEQVGPGFEDWLQLDRHLLVDLPTGSGKTIIGELRTALTLAEGHQVVWLLPTRALVRQANRHLRKAFSGLDVIVEELPTTEDFEPLFIDGFGHNRYVSATTPERLAALIRARPDAIEHVRLVVLDEAQILFDINRGATAELALHDIRRLIPPSRFVLMSAHWEALGRFQSFINHLTTGEGYSELLSNNRPVRHIYGIVTDAEINDLKYPIVELFPPGVQIEDDETEYPNKILLLNNRLPRNFSTTDIARIFTKPVTSAGLRSVMFVGLKVSTETQSEKISRNNQINVELPERDLARLHVELGRNSVIEATAIHGVAPHHGGLSPLEQHTVEKWIRNDIVRAAVATPTLAQGVDLPFDISILSYLTRFNRRTNHRDPLSQAEVLNMLGRAGRAGRVSDGICLISILSGGRESTQVLDSHRRYFFKSQEPIDDLLGIARLMAVAYSVNMDDPDWILELEGANFSEAQTLLSFLLTATIDQDNFESAIYLRLRQFPSIIHLVDQGIDIDVLVPNLTSYVNNIQEICAGDDILLRVLQNTGMPYEVINSFLVRLRDDFPLAEFDNVQKIAWADEVIETALQSCSTREWYKNLFEEIDLDDLIPCIQLWRSGLPIVNIEENWQFKQKERYNRIAIGDFLNHKLTLFAQFWGALEICEQLVFDANNELYLSNMQAFVREGVSSLVALEWKKSVGWLDRVLANRLASSTPTDIPEQQLQRIISEQLSRWHGNNREIPADIDGETRQALLGVLDEIYS